MPGKIASPETTNASCGDLHVRLGDALLMQRQANASQVIRISSLHANSRLLSFFAVQHVNFILQLFRCFNDDFFAALKIQYAVVSFDDFVNMFKVADMGA